MAVDLYSVVKGFCSTEKSSLLLSRGVVVVFVDKAASKPQIARAFEIVFGVKPQRVRVLNTPHVRTRFKGKPGLSLGSKKALVSVGVDSASKFSKTA